MELLLWLHGRRRDLIQQCSIQRRWSAKPAVALQELPLLGRHLQPTANLKIRTGLDLGVGRCFFFKSLQADLQLSLATGQSHGRGIVPEVVEDRPPDMGARKGREGGLGLRAVQFRRPDQPKQAHLDEIIPGFGAAKPVVVSHGLHEVPMGLHKGISAHKRLV